MKSDTVLGLSSKGFHRIHYTDWGSPDAERIVICVHGLTRNGRDFDTLAQALLPDFRVICPDVVGRGKSDWLQAKEDYAYPQYCADMTAVIARVTGKAGGLSGWLGRLLGRAMSEKKRIFWVGTSMGGLIGMVLAAQPKSPIERLILNDVGTLIPRAALERIGNYVGKDLRFKTLEELEAMMRLVLAPFGPLTDAQWRHLTVTGAKRHEDGSWGLCYDPGIAIPFRKGPLADVDLWQFYDAIRCPTLLLRGAQSDLLLKDTAAEMTRRGPKAKLVEFEGIGHAPTLMAGDQITIVRDFLLGN
jgi:pimeloyl-ACP methyl ester carboxylesterase